METIKSSDAKLERAIAESPGLSLIQLSRKTGWSHGRVYASVSRMVKAKRLFLVEDEQSGRKRGRVFPAEYRPALRIRVPRRLLRLSGPAWRASAHFYAIDKDTMVIAGKPMPDWARNARFTAQAPITHAKSSLAFTVPDGFAEFYQLRTRFFSKAISGNNVLITIGARIQ